MRVIDLYCGAGGLSHGLDNAGLDVLLGLDGWETALAIFKRNVRRPAHLCDLSQRPEGLPDADAIVGGPPCQDFSVAGNRSEGSRAQLTVAFAQTVLAYRPRVVALENVPRARRCAAYQKAKRLLGRGYGLTEIILDTSRYGVPQARRRLLLVGQRGGSDGHLEQLLTAGRSEHPLTVREYCGDRLRGEYFYRHARTRGSRAIWSIDEPAMTVTCQGFPMPRGYRPHLRDATKDLAKVRGLTLREASLVQTFPDWWDWWGVRLTDGWTMVGNAVPVRLAEHLGKALLRM